MDLEADVENMDSDDQNNFEKIKRRMIRAIKNGHLVINEEGEAIYTPQNKGSKYQEPIHFHERTGNTAMAMDGKKKYEDVRKTYSVIAEICKIRPSDIVGLRGIDIKMVEGIFALLMD